jgi:biotin operon repressor
MVRYTLEQRVYLYVTHVKYGSARKCRRKFRRKFRDEKVPGRQTIHKLVNELRTTGLLIGKKQKRKHRVLTEKKLDGIGARPEHTHRKSLKRLAQETGVSESSARRATQSLKLRPYKTTESTPCSSAMQLAGFISAVGVYSLSSKVRSIRN